MTSPNKFKQAGAFTGEARFTNQLTIKPPFSFEGLSVRVFPLRANLDAMQRCVDRYLNIAPAEAARFRAAVPYVYLMMIDYGKLAAQASNEGWLSQREIFFGIPMQWYRVIEGKWIFYDWAMFTPFIFVDDNLSVPLGRTVYGWAKTMAQLTPRLSEWMRDPLAPVHEATATTVVFPELFEGRRLEQRVFLEILREAPGAYLQYPVGTHAPLAPWNIASNVAAAIAGYGRDMVGLMASLGVAPMHDGSSPENYLAMLGKIAQGASPFSPQFLANTINLKQFREAHDPERYCYQAITNGPMTFSSFNRGGLLGEERILGGDPSGGYSIQLHEWPSLQIAQTLGLEVDERWQGSGPTVVRVKPVNPFWYDVNMQYLRGSNVAWREDDGKWRTSAGGVFLGQPADVPADEMLFNTTLSSALDAVAGPFRFTGVTARVLPLVAERSTLQKYLDDYLNKPLNTASERYDVWTEKDTDPIAYVYMAAINFTDVTSGTSNVGNWADYELTFLIPVRRRVAGEDGKLKTSGVGLVPAFTYVDGTIAAIGRSEVLGIPTTKATFVRPENRWMSPSGPTPTPEQTLLRVEAEVIPALGQGQQSRMRPIVEIRQGYPMSERDKEARARDAERWSSVMKSEQARQQKLMNPPPVIPPGTSAAMEGVMAMIAAFLASPKVMKLFTLKQFRDVEDPETACYQEIVCVDRTLTDLFKPQPLDPSIVVRIHEFPSEPIVEKLGLVHKAVHAEGAGIVHELHPASPFTFEVTMDEKLGTSIRKRLGRGREDPGAEMTRSVNKANFVVGPSVVEVLDAGDPGRLLQAMEVWREAASDRWLDEPTLDVKDLLAAVDQFDPQTIIQAVLAREWGNTDPNNQWQRARRMLVEAYDKRMVGVSAGEFAKVEHDFFNGILAERGGRPGERSVASAREMIDTLQDLRLKFNRIEVPWVNLSSAVRADAHVRRVGHVDLASTLEYRRALMKSMEEMRATSVEGAGDSPRDQKNLGARNQQDNATAFYDVVEDIRAQTPRSVEDVRHEHRKFERGVDLSRERVELQRDAVFNKLARAWQRPDTCIFRDAEGSDRERLYPMAQSWDENWYYGGKPKVLETLSNEIEEQKGDEAQ